MINLIVPMAGEGSRFAKENILTPKPLVEIKDKPFFYWATSSIYKHTKIFSLTFVVLEKHVEEYNIDKVIKKYYPSANIVILKKVLNGAVLTSVEGVKFIDNDYPIVFNDCDHMFFAPNFYNYLENSKNELDGALLTFKSNNPRFSFVENDENGYVKSTVEKKVISNNAICGAYYFKNKSIFLEAAKEYIDNCSYNEYFMSGLYNIMISKGYKIKNFELDWHIDFGTPEDYKNAVTSKHFSEISI